MTQKNGASDRWAKGTYVVRDDIVELSVEESGGISPNDYHAQMKGEVYAYTWSLDRDQLTLGAVEGAISPGALPGQALDAGRLDVQVDRDRCVQPRAAADRAPHGKLPTEGFDAVGEAA